MPKGYWIAHINVTDMDAYQLYRAKVPDILNNHGGKFLVRARTQTVPEGPARVLLAIVDKAPGIVKRMLASAA